MSFVPLIMESSLNDMDTRAMQRYSVSYSSILSDSDGYCNADWAESLRTAFASFSFSAKLRSISQVDEGCECLACLSYNA